MGDDIVTLRYSYAVKNAERLEQLEAENAGLRNELADTSERLEHVRALLKEYGHIVERLRKGNSRLSAALYRARKHGGMVLFELDYDDDEVDSDEDDDE